LTRLFACMLLTISVTLLSRSHSFKERSLSDLLSVLSFKRVQR